MAGMLGSSPSALYGLVDMGSNGIRYSITSLSPPLSRTLPTVYQDRLGVSLYDAQYDPDTHARRPIPRKTIDEVLTSLRRFQVVCSDFGVAPTNVRILATEATRTAVNSEDYRNEIRKATGWDVNMLTKEMEGRVGAMGVASGFGAEGVEGMVMDLGGGSTQLTWLLSKEGHIRTSPQGSFSFPYGAAAMTQLLAETNAQSDPETARTALADKMKQQFQQAYQELQLPEALQTKAQKGDLRLYLSGGGFRGWGYLLFSQHKVAPYPIPIINGFTVSNHQFMQTASLEKLVQESAEHAEQQSGKGSGIFRISKRRAAQVPAVAFLVNVLVSAIPTIRDIRFCQGGVREGFLFDTLPEDVKAMDPLTCATQQHATESSAQIAELLYDALPADDPERDRTHPTSLTKSLCRAIADLMYLHQSCPKESRAMAALYGPITGVLASVHGVSHVDRALLSLVLCARWDGEVAPPHDDLVTRLQQVVTPQEGWWVGYLGGVAALIGNIYPSGRIPEGRTGERVKLTAKWVDGLGKKGLEMGVKLTVCCREGDAVTDKEAGIRGWVDDVEKIGKRKRRDALERMSGAGAASGNGKGVGVRVEVEVIRASSFDGV